MKLLSPLIARFAVVAIFSLVLLLTSCSKKHADSYTPPDPTAIARIITRTNADDVPPIYPVRIYAINATGKCAATQVINSADDDIRLPLPAGTFTIYALGGATSTHYTLPDSATLASTTLIGLKTDNGLHSELQADHATITLEDGQTETLTLTMERAIIGITATLNNVPQAVTAATIALQPLAPALQLNGACTDGDPVKVTIPLGSSAQTWSTASTYFTLPATGKLTVTIALTTADGTESYSYSTNITPAAGYKLDIEAAYAAGAPQIEGTITGTDWKGTESIAIDFGPGSTEEEEGADLPQAGDVYEGCYVLAATPTALLLLASQEVSITGTTGNSTTDQISAYLAGYTETVAGTTAWHLPDTDEASDIYTHFTAINAALKGAGETEMGAGVSYTFIDGSQVVRAFGKSAPPTDAPKKVSETSGPYVVRPVCTIEL